MLELLPKAARRRYQESTDPLEMLRLIEVPGAGVDDQLRAFCRYCLDITLPVWNPPPALVQWLSAEEEGDARVAAYNESKTILRESVVGSTLSAAAYVAVWYTRKPAGDNPHWLAARWAAKNAMTALGYSEALESALADKLRELVIVPTPD